MLGIERPHKSQNNTTHNSFTQNLRPRAYSGNKKSNLLQQAQLEVTKDQSIEEKKKH